MTLRSRLPTRLHTLEQPPPFLRPVRCPTVYMWVTSEFMSVAKLCVLPACAISRAVCPSRFVSTSLNVQTAQRAVESWLRANSLFKAHQRMRLSRVKIHWLLAIWKYFRTEVLFWNMKLGLDRAYDSNLTQDKMWSILYNVEQIHHFPAKIYLQ